MQVDPESGVWHPCGRNEREMWGPQRPPTGGWSQRLERRSLDAGTPGLPAVPEGAEAGPHSPRLPRSQCCRRLGTGLWLPELCEDKHPQFPAPACGPLLQPPGQSGLPGQRADGLHLGLPTSSHCPPVGGRASPPVGGAPALLYPAYTRTSVPSPLTRLAHRTGFCTNNDLKEILSVRSFYICVGVTLFLFDANL